MTNKTFKKLKLPDKPGVYFFMKGKEILYIGKATSLKDRVKSYFGAGLIETRGPIILDMVFKADKIKWEITDSVLEALILEVNLIKKHQPKYNTKEKSDKSFNYVCITKEKLPRVVIKRGKDLKEAALLYSDCFGPYPKSSELKTALTIIRKIFPFFDDRARMKNNQEFYRQIKLVPETEKELLRNILNLRLFFYGKKKKITENLQREMKKEAKKRNFEEAAETRNQIFSLKHINDVALIKEDFSGKKDKTLCIEAYDIAHMGGKNMVGVMTVVKNGEVEKSEYKKFKIKTQTDANDTGALREVLKRRFGHPEWPYPGLIVIDGGIAQINSTKAVLAKLKIEVPVVSVVKDERHKPKAILFPPRSDLKGAQDPTLIKKYKREILLANSEAHRCAIAYHKKIRNKNFLENFLK